MKTFTLLKTFVLTAALCLFGMNAMAAYSTGTFNKITSASDLTSGYYVFTFDKYAMNNTNGGSFFGNTDLGSVPGASITDPAATIVWKVEVNGTGYSIYNEATSKYVSYTGSSNAAYAVDAVSADAQRWTFTWDSGTSLWKVGNAATPARLLQYNTGSPRFACYTGSQKNIVLYKMATQTVTPTITVTEASLPEFTTIRGTEVTNTLHVAGSNLTANIDLALSGTNADQFTVTPASLTQTEGAVASTPVTVTYKGTETGTHSAVLTLTSAGAENKTFNLTGTTTNPVLVAPVATAASAIDQTIFTANWEAVTHATSYELSVYSESGTDAVTVFSENFDVMAAAGALNNSNTPSISNIAPWSAANATKVYAAGGSLKAGASNDYTSVTTPTFTGTIGQPFTITFNAMAWVTDAQTMTVSLNGTTVLNITDLPNTTATANLTKADFKQYTITGVFTQADNTITFAPGTETGKHRFYLDDVTVIEGGKTKTMVTGFPKSVTGTTYNVTDLSANTEYFYSVKAEADDYITSAASNVISVTTTGTPTDVTNPTINAIYVKDGNVVVNANAGQAIEVYSVTGQRLTSVVAIEGENTISLSRGSVYVVRVNNTVAKIVM